MNFIQDKKRRYSLFQTATIFSCEKLHNYFNSWYAIFFLHNIESHPVPLSRLHLFHATVELNIVYLITGQPAVFCLFMQYTRFTGILADRHEQTVYTSLHIDTYIYIYFCLQILYGKSPCYKQLNPLVRSIDNECPRRPQIKLTKRLNSILTKPSENLMTTNIINFSFEA